MHDEIASYGLWSKPSAAEEGCDAFDTRLFASLAAWLEPLDEHATPAPPGCRSDLDADSERLERRCERRGKQRVLLLRLCRDAAEERGRSPAITAAMRGRNNELGLLEKVQVGTNRVLMETERRRKRCHRLRLLGRSQQVEKMFPCRVGERSVLEGSTSHGQSFPAARAWRISEFPYAESGLPTMPQERISPIINVTISNEREGDHS